MKLLLVIISTSLFYASSVFSCPITVRIKNETNNVITVNNTDLSNYSSRVRTKSGPHYRKLKKGKWYKTHSHITLDPQQERGDVYHTTGRCKAKRKYKISYTCPNGGRTFSTYYPSASSYTRSTYVIIPVGSACTG